ncbi:MAG: hypothetical protein ABSE56_09890 [Bryobacteraceae bacterium]|jgi:hypothetical protein
MATQSSNCSTTYKRLVAVYRSWQQLEQSGKYRPSYDIIDFDLARLDAVGHFESRHSILSELDGIAEALRSASCADTRVVQDLQASRTFLRVLLGEKVPFDKYIWTLMGIHPASVPEGRLARMAEEIRHLLHLHGLAYTVEDHLRYTTTFGVHSPEVLRERILASRSFWLDRLAKVVQLPSTLPIDITVVVKDEPWSFGLSGKPDGGILLEINAHERHSFTTGQCDYIPSHEIAGHAVQFLSWKRSVERGEAPEVLALISTHHPTIALSEGLAQALPYFLCSQTDLPPEMLIAKKLREHRDAVLSNAQLMLWSGGSLDSAWKYAISQLPFATALEIERELAQRSLDPLQSAYLYCYTPYFLAFKDLASRLDKRERLEFLQSQYNSIPSVVAFWARCCGV